MPGEIIRNENLILTRLPSEAILLDPATQEMYSLNLTGCRIWDALPAPSVDVLVDRVLPDLRVDPIRGAADIRSFITALIAAGLVRERLADGV